MLQKLWIDDPVSRQPPVPAGATDD
jgi:hypothetical protein